MPLIHRERETFGESKRVKVRVRNACDFWIPPEESWFEITAMPANGQGIAGRATRQLPDAHRPELLQRRDVHRGRLPG